MLKSQELFIKLKPLRILRAKLVKDINALKSEANTIVSLENEIKKRARKISESSLIERIRLDLLEIKNLKSFNNKINRKLSKDLKQFSLYFKSIENEARVLEKKEKDQKKSKKPNKSKKLSKYIINCLKCGKTTHTTIAVGLYCLKCDEVRKAEIKNIEVQRKFMMKELRIQSQIFNSLKSRWPDNFSGKALQGGSPGLGK